MMVQEGGPRKNAFSAEQSRGQKVRFAIKRNVLDNSVSGRNMTEGGCEIFKRKLLPPH